MTGGWAPGGREPCLESSREARCWWHPWVETGVAFSTENDPAPNVHGATWPRASRTVPEVSELPSDLRLPA